MLPIELCYIIFLRSPLFNFQEEEEVTAEFLAGKVPEIVYKKAIQCIPGAVINNVIVNKLAIRINMSTVYMYNVELY